MPIPAMLMPDMLLPACSSRRTCPCRLAYSCRTTRSPYRCPSRSPCRRSGHSRAALRTAPWSRRAPALAIVVASAVSPLPPAGLLADQEGALGGAVQAVGNPKAAERTVDADRAETTDAAEAEAAETEGGPEPAEPAVQAKPAVQPEVRAGSRVRGTELAEGGGVQRLARGQRDARAARRDEGDDVAGHGHGAQAEADRLRERQVREAAGAQPAEADAAQTDAAQTEADGRHAGAGAEHRRHRDCLEERRHRAGGRVDLAARLALHRAGVQARAEERRVAVEAEGLEPGNLRRGAGDHRAQRHRAGQHERRK